MIMDSAREPKHHHKTKIALAILVLLVVIVLMGVSQHRMISTVSSSELELVTVEGFRTKITTMGTIKPRKSIKLSSDIGGRVKYYINKKQSYVQQGDILLELENYDYTLNITEKVAQVSEQISNLRNTRLNLASEMKSTQLSLEDAIFNVRAIDRELEQKERLLTKGLISKSDVQYLQDDLSRWIAKQKVLSTYYQSQKNKIQHQLTELNETVDILKNFLLKLQESERNLVVRAPISGNLVGFDIELGQQILPKEEFGSLDIIDNFLIEVELSEFYLDRVNESMQVLATFDNRNVELNVLKIFPKVKQGQFRMHLEVRLLERVARNIKVGQSIEIELTNATETLQPSVPVNATFKENSNMFVYLLSKNQSKAVKTPISIKNTIGNVLLVDNMDLLGKTLIVLDWDKNYEEELYID